MMNSVSPSINNAEVKAAFEQDGFYIARGVFDQQTLAALESDFDRIIRQLMDSNEDINARWSGPEVEKMGAADTVVYHTHNVQQYSSRWLRAMLDERFLAYAQAILGEDIVLHHSKLFQKPSEKGAPFPMHQDWGYFPTIKDTMMAGIIHVSDATDEMGCLRVYPGSHRLGRLDDSLGNVESMLLEEYPIERATPLEAKAGDVVFFHYCTIHGSLPNRSDRVRKTVLIQLHSGQDRVEDGVTHPEEKLVLSGWNTYMTRNLANRQS